MPDQPPPAPRRVLYFTISGFGQSGRGNGGDMYAANMVRRLQEDDGITLFVLNAASPAGREASERWFADRRIDMLFQPILTEFPYPRSAALRDVATFLKLALLRFDYELEAYAQSHLAAAVAWAIAHWRIDCLLVDSVIAALFAGDLTAVTIPKVIVTVNREAELYRDLQIAAGCPRGRWVTRTSVRRFARFERRTYLAFDKVVAIGRPDIPSYLSPARTAVVTPYLDARPRPWRFTGQRTLFFVGNVAYLPNRLAIDYIVGRIAPLLLSRHADLRVRIVGAGPADIDPRWRHPAIELLGVSTGAEVASLFGGGGGLLCVPIANTFGVKFKVAEALAYGTPFLASPQTMLGLPYLADLAAPSLDAPQDWADAVSALLGDPAGIALQALSQELLSRQRAFAASQRGIWSRTL